MKKIMVTGDRGYIGAVLVPKLIEKGYGVIGIDIGYANDSEFDNEKLEYTYITKDVRDIESSDLKGIDAIIHLSALSNDPIGELNPKLTIDINHKSTIRLAKLAKKMKVERFIFSSSCSVYGIASNGVVDEKSKANPLTAYAKSKILSEKALAKLSSGNFCIGLMRNSTVYGYSPKFRNDLVVNNLVTCALALNKIKVLSDGSPWRPLIDVRDLADFFIKFLEIDASIINGKIFNVGFNENNFMVKNIVEKISKELPNTEIIFTGEHGHDSRSYKVKFDKVHKIFPDLSQKWTIDNSIKDLIINLNKLGFSRKEFDDEKYIRLANLKKLISKGKFDNNLRLQ